MKLQKTVEYQFKTSDFDGYLHLKPFSILDYLQEIAGLHAFEIGLGREALLKRNYAWVIMRSKYEIIKHPKVNEKICAKTWPQQKGRIDFNRDYQIYSQSGEILINATSKWVVLDIQTRRLVRGTDIDYCGEHVSEIAIPGDFEKINSDVFLDAQFVFDYIVRNSDLDSNSHMNNAKYGDIVFNCIDLRGGLTIKQLEIDYINEAKLNDIIKVYSVCLYNNFYYLGKINDKDCFYAKILMEEEK